MAETKSPKEKAAKRLGVTVEQGRSEEPMKVYVQAMEYGWEVTFDPAPMGECIIYDLAGNQVNASVWGDGSRMQLVLNIADWGITEDMVKDALKQLSDSGPESTTSDSS